jgi:hypothetical protein
MAENFFGNLNTVSQVWSSIQLAKMMGDGVIEQYNWARFARLIFIFPVIQPELSDYDDPEFPYTPGDQYLRIF